MGHAKGLAFLCVLCNDSGGGIDGLGRKRRIHVEGGPIEPDHPQGDVFIAKCFLDENE